MTHTLNLRGRLLELREPQIMGILNVTPDSFYSDSRTPDEAHITDRVRQMMDEGADMIDVGGYSSRSGADDVTPEEEMDRLRRGLRIVRKLYPEVPVSVDTFRADVARMCIEEEGADIINDISGGMMDRQMFRTVARLGVPYILMHMQGTPDTMQVAPHYDNLRREVMLYFAERIDRLCQMGAKDIIVDPGFGFGKTLEHNYELMNHLEDFAVFNLPLLVGISRKSMIYKLTGGTPQSSLNGTTVLNTISLVKGAHILRVHDVKAAAEAKQIYMAVKQNACGQSDDFQLPPTVVTAIYSENAQHIRVNAKFWDKRHHRHLFGSHIAILHLPIDERIELCQHLWRYHRLYCSLDICVANIRDAFAWLHSRQSGKRRFACAHHIISRGDTSFLQHHRFTSEHPFPYTHIQVKERQGRQCASRGHHAHSDGMYEYEQAKGRRTHHY